MIALKPLEILAGSAAALAVEPPISLEQDLLVWVFRGVLGLAFALIYHQLREANKKLARVGELDDLERFIGSIVAILADGAEKGGRSTDKLVLTLKQELDGRAQRRR